MELSVSKISADAESAPASVLNDDDIMRLLLPAEVKIEGDDK